jgi:lipid-A-disaccharide synthase-like uncharacterized protein
LIAFAVWFATMIALRAVAVPFIRASGWFFAMLGALIAYALLMRRDPTMISAEGFGVITDGE